MFSEVSRLHQSTRGLEIFNRTLNCKKKPSRLFSLLLLQPEVSKTFWSKQFAVTPSFLARAACVWQLGCFRPGCAVVLLVSPKNCPQEMSWILSWVGSRWCGLGKNRSESWFFPANNAKKVQHVLLLEIALNLHLTSLYNCKILRMGCWKYNILLITKLTVHWTLFNAYIHFRSHEKAWDINFDVWI